MLSIHSVLQMKYMDMLLRAKKLSSNLLDKCEIPETGTIKLQHINND